MKSFLCLLLIAFIVSESVDKNNEIVLKANDFIDEYYDKILKIYAECCHQWYNIADQIDCTWDKVLYYNGRLTYEESMKYHNYLASKECYDYCYEKLNNGLLSQLFCSFCYSN